jgi:dihydroorotate dehydrogenase electron transfer subunit
MKKIVADHQVIDITFPEENNYIIRFKAPQEIPEIRAGNFAEIYINTTPDVFLRRPISVLDVDYKERIVSFYIKAIGKGTKHLGTYQKNDTVNIIYPLGNSFSINEQHKKVLMIGGGSGIAPFILLGKELQKKNIEATILLGGKSKNDILLTEEFGKYADVKITTEDGSLGEKGLVTQHSIFHPENFNFDMIYTCGPDPMMKAIAKIANERKVECEASLENMMACGFGACLCCVTPTDSGNLRVCMEGPVFDVKKLKWQI